VSEVTVDPEKAWENAFPRVPRKEDNVLIMFHKEKWNEVRSRVLIH
jgi:hypothetical protein